MKPKTWRISAFADARMTPLVLVDHEVYHALTNCGPYFKRSLRPSGFLQIFKDFFSSFFRSISQKRSEFFFRRFCFIIRVPKLVLAVFFACLSSVYGCYNCTIPPPVRFFKNTCTSFSVDRVKILTLKTTNIST